MRLVDLSHRVEAGMQTYPGLPGPILCDFLTREASRALYTGGTTFQIGKIELVANTGTYVDAPFHRFEGRADLSELPLERLADLETLVVTPGVDRARAIGPEAFDGLALAGKAVLVRTGWSRHWRTPAYMSGHPFLTRAAAEHLVAAGAAFVGIDSLNIDDTGDGTRPVHTALLGADIPIGEHFTNLAALPAAGARLHATPVKVRGMGTFPVRAYALIPALVLALAAISGCTTVAARADASLDGGGDGAPAEAAADAPPASGHRPCTSDADCSGTEATCQTLTNAPG